MATGLRMTIDAFVCTFYNISSQLDCTACRTARRISLSLSLHHVHLAYGALVQVLVDLGAADPGSLHLLGDLRPQTLTHHLTSSAAARLPWLLL